MKTLVRFKNQPMDYDVQKAINQSESIVTNPPVIPKSQTRMKGLKSIFISSMTIIFSHQIRGDDLPVIIWANGCGQNSSVYFNLLNELASKGYAVVQSNKETATKKCIDL